MNHRRGDAEVANNRDLFYRGNVVARRRWRRLNHAVGSMAHGSVLEIGLGFGVTRRALARSVAVSHLETVEWSSDIIELWRLHRGGGLFEDSEENAERVVTHADADNYLEVLANQGRTFDVISLDVDELLGRRPFRNILRALLPNLGSRLLLQRDVGDRTPRGFRSRVVMQEEGRELVVLDRWAPRQGLGSVRPGKARMIGRGWVT